MARGTSRNLTTGPISDHFRTLAIPAAIGMLFNTLYNVVDMFYAGMLDTSAQAGLALGFLAFLIAMSTGIGLGTAMGALVGNALGAGDSRRARRLGAQGLSYALLCALVLMVAGAWYAPRIITLVSESGAYRAAGIDYYLWLSLALPGFLLTFGCNGILQAHGDSRSMQRALMVAFFANIGLNPLFVWGVPGIWEGMGFKGLALSTVASQTGVMVYMIRQMLRLETMARLRRRMFRPHLPSFREISKQSLPTSFAMIVLFLSGFVLQFALKGFGPEAVAGYAVALRLEQILLLPVLGLTGALLPIVSQNLGAQQFDRVREAVFFCWKTGCVMTALACPVLWLLGRPVLTLFNPDPEVVRIGVAYLRIEGLILPAYMMLFSINSLLQALKRPVWSIWIGLYRQAFGIAFFVWVFVGLLGFGVIGIFLGIACAVLTGLLIALLVVRRITSQEIGGLWGKPATQGA